MVWIIILICVFLILCWLFLAPLEFYIDTRTPQLSLRWISIGKAAVVYEKDEWLLQIRILFFHRQWKIQKLIHGRKKRKKRIKRVSQKRKPAKTKRIKKLLNLLRTFRVTNWRLAMDTGDCVQNAWLFPLNFYPGTREHLFINFTDENYLVIKIRNAPWKLAYALMR